MACQFGHLAVVRELIAAGADIDAQATDGSDTALIRAATEGHDEVVQELLAAGADACLGGHGYMGWTALGAAIANEHSGPPVSVDPERPKRFRRIIDMLNARKVPRTATNDQVRQLEQIRREQEKFMADLRKRELRERHERESRQRAAKARRSQPFCMPNDARIDLAARDFWRRERLLAQ